MNKYGLKELKPQSRARFSTPTVYTFSEVHKAYIRMVKKKVISNGKFGAVIKRENLMHGGKQRIQKVMTFQNDNILAMVNRDLSGGQSYPILNFALSAIGGRATALGGLIFGLATTFMDVFKTSTNVLARPGDELWLVEEVGIGVETGYFSSSKKPMYVQAYFLVDPNRNMNLENGWLIHEKRMELSIE